MVANDEFRSDLPKIVVDGGFVVSVVLVGFLLDCVLILYFGGGGLYCMSFSVAWTLVGLVA